MNYEKNETKMNTIALVALFKFNFEFGVKFDSTWVFTLIQNTWYSKG